jgi:hypothetical protein
MNRDYKTFDDSTKPGYLQRRMALYRAQVQAEAERKAKAEKAATANVKPIKAAHG